MALKLTRREKQIIEVLEELGEVTSDLIAAGLSINANAAGQNLRRMKKKGLVKSAGRVKNVETARPLDVYRMTKSTSNP